ncbi:MULTISPECIES: flagellar biosynthetic protein FliQ [Photobacterium]|jgi:flagellar biosynthetic protein FliQ|uniref:Flagellar biosynthetic protein FliQ n=1 Tax=Photobacterium alginatilyticum TaxID=1775171 RepID=A0ABW9YMV1_9GAMM|nr:MULTISPECIES: flagellar biosynthetic protein FliQ [Photobacterium]MCG7584414.1 flagellar biosynthetic protein FliQ [Photobacterium sp. OFAV2-7]NBI55133.1 flagellar biosynthetic protein FliQ [Photobacterium alginatilyticum]
MGTEFIASFFGEALLIIVSMVCVMIVPSLLVGLVVSIFQAATQINEQTLSFLPRLLMTFAMLGFAGPWLLRTLGDLFNRLFLDIPHLIG